MSRTNSFLVSVTLLAGLTTACGPNAATAEDSAKNAEATEALTENSAALDISASDAGAALTAEEPAAAAVASASAPEKVAATNTVKSLPLKRGFYVASDTPCNQASNATLLLVTREGINGSRDVCKFTKIERSGALIYRVTDSCSADTATYEIPNDTSFNVKYEGGSEKSARFCAQSSLPDPWRDNDISDIIG